MPLALIPFLLLAVPIVEIGAFITIGGQIGIGLTLLMILVTAIIGTMLLRVQGLNLIGKIQSEIAAGSIPGRALGDAAMIMVAGILLLTPGFVTDSLGFLLFVPFVRGAIWKFLSTRISVAMPGMAQDMENSSQGTQYYSDRDGPIIDLDEEEFSSAPSDSDSPWKKDNRES